MQRVNSFGRKHRNTSSRGKKSTTLYYLLLYLKHPQQQRLTKEWLKINCSLILYTNSLSCVLWAISACYRKCVVIL